MEFGVLGSLQILGPSGPIDVRGARERLLLAHLLAAAGRPLPVSTLIDGLWGDDPPRTAGKALQNLVLRVRRAIEPDRSVGPQVLVTEAGGYRLVTESLHVDAQRFEALVRSSTSLPGEARSVVLREALGLWRGPAYSGLTDAPLVAAEARRLAEVRYGAQEACCEAELEGGSGPDLVAELEGLVAEHPLRERLWALLMRALYQEGRQGEALGAFARAREVLSAELGVDPGPELRDLHARVLAQDPGLSRIARREQVPRALRIEGGPSVGRDDELERLRHAWNLARTDGPRRVVIRGPVGAGGWRLAAELARTVVATGGHVTYVGPDGAEGETGRPGPRLVVVDRGAVEPEEPPAPSLVVTLVGATTEPPLDSVRIDLAPLDLRGTRRVVSQVVPAELVEDVLGEVWAESGGWPGRAHHAATSLVRRRVAAEVEAAAGRAGSASAALAAARSEMATGVLGLRESAALPALDPGTSPWPGLPAYSAADAAGFAGRERLVAELVSRLPGAPFLSVVGASGSGKSSAVHAGLLATLRDGQLPGSTAWSILTMRPGRRPGGELTRALLDAGRAGVGDLLERLVRAPEGSEERNLLVVDQFEECWTECHDAAERAGFLDTLAELVGDPDNRTTVVAVLRADFLPRVAEHPTLATALADNTVLVGTPTPDDVRRAIVVPARRAGLELEAGLVDALVADAGAEPGLLPLLSTSMRHLWEARDGNVLTLSSYVASGGLRGAIALLAESEYAVLDEAQRADTRGLFLRLAGTGEGDEVVRRRVRRAELDSLPRDITPVLERLADARLLSVSADSVEVAHEALFREWPRLGDWLADDKVGRALQRKLAVAALEWRDEGEEAGLLWSGARLEAAREVSQSRSEEITDLERRFLDAGQDAELAAGAETQRAAAEKVRQNRRLRMLLAGALALLLVAVVAGAIALRARSQEAASAREAEQTAVAADAKRLAASALTLEQSDLALLTAVEATRLERSPETYGAVLTLLAREPDVTTRFRIDSRFMAVAADNAGDAVYLGEERPVLWAVDAETGDVLWRQDLPGAALGLAVAPTGGEVAAVLFGGDAEDLVVVLDRSGRELWRIPLSRVNDFTGGDAGYLWNGLGWTHDGRLVFATDQHVVVASGGGTLAAALPWGHPMVDDSTFLVWPDGRVSAGGADGSQGRVLDTRRPKAPATTSDAAVGAVSPDGDSVAGTRVTPAGTELVLLDADTRAVKSPAWPLDGVLSFMRFSPEGDRLLVGVDERFEVRDGRTGAPVSAFTGLASDAFGAVYAGPAHDLIWTAGRDGSAVAFDAAGRRGVISAGPSPDSPWAGEGAAEAHVEIWSNRDDFAPDVAFLRSGDSRRGRRLPLTGLGACTCEVTSTDLTTDGSLALAGVRVLSPEGAELPDEGYVVAWDVASRQVRAAVPTPWPVESIDSAPEGDRAVLSGAGGWATLDLSTMELGEDADLDTWTRFGWGTSLVEVSPDGSRAALLRGQRVLVVDLDAGQVVTDAAVEPDQRGSLQSAAWSPDGSNLAVGSTTGWFYVLDSSTLEPAAPRRLLTGGPVADVEVSPDGQVAATLEGADGDVTLWDVATWRPFGQAVLQDRGVGFLRFDPDSVHLEVVFNRGVRARVAIDPAAWVAAACDAANRELTADEVAIVRGDGSSVATCSVTVP